MDTQATTTMSTKRSRRRTARGTRARGVVRDAALPPLVPAKARTRFTNVDKAVLDSRLRGNERSEIRHYPARLRSTKQAPPARRMLPHSVSAAARVSAPTRTW